MARLANLQIAQALQPHLTRPLRRVGEAGTSSGVNIAPGFDDDGWVVPPPVRLADGTSIQLYKDGEALHAAFAAIEKAQRRICLEVYIFASDSTGRAFSDLLCRKSREGVSVYAIYDDFGSIDSQGQMFEQMRRAGVNLRVFHPVWPWECQFSWRPALRDHRKLLVIDDEIAGMGGLNIGAEYAGSWVVNTDEDPPVTGPWRDNAIGITGPSARLLLRSFARTWHYVNHGGRMQTAELIHNLDGGDFGLLASAPTRSSPLAPLFRRLMREARSSAQFTMAYFAPTDDLLAELCRAARRGVKVQLMLPAKSDIAIVQVAARSFYETLLSAGVEIFERQEAVLHAKTMVIDGCTTVVGSANLDYRSIESNFELSAIIRSPELGQQMQALFAHDVRFANRIELSEWRRRPIRDRIVQWAVQRARYVL